MLKKRSTDLCEGDNSEATDKRKPVAWTLYVYGNACRTLRVSKVNISQ